MTTQLTHSELTLLERFYDEELEAQERARAQALLERSPAARVFLSALEELTTAARAAEELVWSQAEPPPASAVVERALSAVAFAEQPLEELAPLLERFHDGEVLAEERAIVQALLNERDDVADYLAGLEALSTGVRASHEEAAQEVSFDGFWDAVASKIDAEETAFDPEEHQVLLYRYHDGEVSDAERDQVAAWLEAGDEDVVATLAALDEIELATRASVELAQEQVDLSAIWHGVEEAIDDAIEAQGENVVSLSRERRKKGFLSDYRQGIVGAVAAVLAVALVGGVFSEQIFGPQERVVVEKTVVIVDSVEYAPGSSVMVNSPMQQASARIESPEGEAESEEPTVIWLLDSGEDNLDEDAPQVPADEGEDENVEEEQTPDTGDRHRKDQPI